MSTPDSVAIYHSRKGDRGSPWPIIGWAQFTTGGVPVELHNEVLQGDAAPPPRYKLELASESNERRKNQRGL
ncbi:MAG: hypothetical protein L7W43_00780 [Rubripirellula sp.]|nr:hypothetical protein [Rhodopirellula sp.]MCH1438160.1 hypothetical protein [Rubripirellula sp.]OUX03642.1 MAG: hypothetical protein CBE00_13900 [Planctomycetaceae bacterium TMED240]